MSDKLKIQISICSTNGMSHNSFLCYHHMLLWNSKNTNHEFTMCYAYRTFIHMARKACVKQAIETGADYLIFLDDDMIWPVDMWNTLAMNCEKHDLDMLSGYYTTRKEIPFPLIYAQQPDGQYSPYLPKEESIGGIIPCDATGFGALCIKTDVFNRVPEPWFELPDSMTEDIFFFNKCIEAGIKCHVHTGMACGHSGEYGWCFPYKCDLENAVNGRIIRSDEELRKTGQIEDKKGNTDGTPSQECSSVSGPISLVNHG